GRVTCELEADARNLCWAPLDHHLKMDIAGWGTSRGTVPEAAHPPVVRRQHRWEQHPRMAETRGGRQRNKRANLRLARDARGRSRRTPVQQEPLRQGQGRLLRRVAAEAPEFCPTTWRALRGLLPILGLTRLDTTLLCLKGVQAKLSAVCHPGS